MSANEYYEGFSEEKQKEYAEEARQRWGAETVDESNRRWNRLTPQQQAAKQAEQDRLTRALVEHMADGPESPEVQRLVAAFHQEINFYYDCTYEIFEALGHGYNQDERFHKMYATRYHPDLPAFLEQAITYYCNHQR